jgi:hypothetical protein
MLTVSLPSYATVVLPTQTVIPGALTSAAGTLLAAEAAPFTAISYSGVLRAAVYLNPNPTEVCPAGNCLDFYYQVQNNGPDDSVARETDFVLLVSKREFHSERMAHLFRLAPPLS